MMCATIGCRGDIRNLATIRAAGIIRRRLPNPTLVGGEERDDNNVSLTLKANIASRNVSVIEQGVVLSPSLPAFWRQFHLLDGAFQLRLGLHIIFGSAWRLLVLRNGRQGAENT